MDAKERLSRRVGDSPLLRAPTLSKVLGLPNLRVKLEGTNPTGTQKDRIAYLEVENAVSHGHDRITAASCGNFGVAVAYAANVRGLHCDIFTPDHFQGERIELMEKLGAVVHRVPGTYEDAVRASRMHARNENAYDGNPGGTSTMRVLAGYGPIAEEILRQTDVVPNCVAVSVGNGSTLAGIHLGFRNAWARGEIDRIPIMLAGTSRGNNPIVAAAARDQDRCTPLDPRSVHETAVNEPLVNWDALDGTAALTAVRDSRGSAYGVEDERLLELHDALLTDGFDAHPASLAAVGAIADAIEEGLVDRDGICVAVLTSGRATIGVERLAERPADWKGFLGELDTWLGRYSDPEAEIDEAVGLAFDDGHVLAATDAEGMLGICALTPMTFKSFFPKYHLSYIAVAPRARGRGVGSLLMEEAIRITRGDVSLHVETDNEKAIRLYEKFGFSKKYYRMIYSGASIKTDPAAGSGWAEHQPDVEPPEHPGHGDEKKAGKNGGAERKAVAVESKK
ncbi:MAG: pyridoxal-phosphate dependent enzyme [Euryarchaeota archaeon]|nr:pyridoxal-phosphate dependent enzyme [Euryarchaeota archaeon]